jgi:hypothetical protein
MKTLAAFSKPIDAHLLIAKLEGSGVRAFARDEHMVTLDWLASNAIGGVKVDVADEDYDRALAVMAAPGDAEPAGTATSGPQPPELSPREAETVRAFNRGIVSFLLGAVPLAVAFFLITPAPDWSAPRRLDEGPPMDSRPLAAVLGGGLGGTLVVMLTRRKRPPR